MFDWLKKFSIWRGGGNAYYCKALSGLSSYNICINCDLTVSCNCQDYDGSGQIGEPLITFLHAMWILLFSSH